MCVVVVAVVAGGRALTSAISSDSASESAISAATRRGSDDDPIGFGTRTRIQLGGTDRSTWNVTVRAPDNVEFNRGFVRFDVSVQLESTTGTGPIMLPVVDLFEADPWLIGRGGAPLPPGTFGDRDACRADVLPSRIRLSAGEQVEGALCLWPGPEAGEAFGNNPEVVLKTPIEEVVWTADGLQDDAGIEIDRSTAALGSERVSYGAPVAVDLGQRVDEIWNVTVEPLQDAEGRQLGDPALRDENQVVMFFSLQGALVEASDSSASMDNWFELLGGATGRAYIPDLGPGSCSGGRDIEPTWAPVGYSFTTSACVVLAGADAASSETVLTLAGPKRDYAVFHEAGTVPAAEAVPVAEVPFANPVNEPLIVPGTLQDFSQWTVSPPVASVSAIGDATLRDLTINLVVSITDDPADFELPEIIVLGGASRQVHRLPCIDEPPDLLIVCIQVPEADADDPDTRIGIKINREFVFFG